MSPALFNVQKRMQLMTESWEEEEGGENGSYHTAGESLEAQASWWPCSVASVHVWSLTLSTIVYFYRPLGQDIPSFCPRKKKRKIEMQLCYLYHVRLDVDIKSSNLRLTLSCVHPSVFADFLL